MGDIFGEDAPPVRLKTTIASPRTEERRGRPVPVWVTISRTRAVVTVLLVGGFTWWYLFPAPQAVALTAAALSCQCLRRWSWARWFAWSLICAALGAGALALGTWPLRFAACLLLIGPMVWFAGSALRDV